MYKLFHRTVIFIFAITFCISAQGREPIIYVEPRPPIPVSFSREVARIVDGDTVRITKANGELIASFTNLEFIKEGTYGRVFKANNEKDEFVAVKFPKSNWNTKYATDTEVASIKVLEKENLPVVRVIRYQPHYFVEKPYIPGGTLMSTNENWQNLTAEEASERIAALPAFVGRLNASIQQIEDLHSGNIIWDSDRKVWEILDPGNISTVPAGTANSAKRFLKSIEDFGGPEIKAAVSFSLVHPEWASRYVHMQFLVRKLNTPAGEIVARTFFAAHPALGSEVPSEYRELWEKGLQSFNAIVGISGKNTPAETAVEVTKPHPITCPTKLLTDLF